MKNYHLRSYEKPIPFFRGGSNFGGEGFQFGVSKVSLGNHKRDTLSLFKGVYSVSKHTTSMFMYAVMFRGVLGRRLKSKTKVMYGCRNSNDHLVTQPMVWEGVSIWGGGVSKFESEYIF